MEEDMEAGGRYFWGFNKMKTTIVYWGYIGIMEKKMETTIYCSRDHIGVILG